jgi:P-type E1-E2 ATPase
LANLYDAEKNDWQPVQWANIKIGDILRVRGDEFIPADMVILSSSGPKGTCYVETKNLDGETNLKIKNA